LAEFSNQTLFYKRASGVSRALFSNKAR